MFEPFTDGFAKKLTVIDFQVKFVENINLISLACNQLGNLERIISRILTKITKIAEKVKNSH